MKKKTFEEVNKNLSLLPTSEWGIMNGTANRIKEFIEYYNSFKTLLEDTTKFDYQELVIVSMNDAILENKVTNEVNFLFKEFIYQHLDNKLYFETTYVYWMSIASKEEFPVGFLLLEIIEPTHNS